MAPVVLVLGTGQAFAAAHLTLQEVAQKVVLGNPEVLSKWHSFKAAIGDVDVAKSGFLPKLDYTYGSAREKLIQPGANERNYPRSGHTVALNQVLYDGFATLSDVRRLDSAKVARYFELVEAAEAAALEAGRAYYDVMRYRLLLLLAEGNFVEHRASYEQLLRRAQTGAGRRVDVEHAASRLALAELNLHTEAANLHDVTARYIRLVGEPPPPVMFPPPGLSAKMPPTETDAVKVAFRLNPTLRTAIENVSLAQHDIELRRAAMHPRLDLRMRSENTENYQGVAGTRRNDVAEVLLSFNIFNGGADMARQRLFAERRNLALDMREKTCRDIRQTLSIAYNDVGRLRAQLANLDLQVSSIEKTRDAYKAQFNIGQRSLLDLLDTENELLNARRTSVNSDMDLGIAYLRTQAGIGRLMEFLGVRARGLDEAIPLETGDGDNICPPETPGSYLVNLEALTARALAQLEAAKPAVVVAAARSDSAAGASAGLSLSVPPPLPGAAGSEAVAPGRPQPPAPQAAATPSSAVVPAPTAPAVSTGGAAREARKPADIVSERINGWAEAWSQGSFERYSGFYGERFKPSDGASRDAWMQQRAARVRPDAGISVEIEGLELEAADPEVVVARFVQKYRSRKYSDQTLKVLRWVRAGDEWVIDSEGTLKPAVAPAGKGSL